MTEALYRKVMRGKRVTYELAYNSANFDNDLMRPGQFRLVHAYSDGSRRSEYDVTPDTAGFVAAASIARIAMEDAIREAARCAADAGSATRPYTKKELRIIEKYRNEMHAIGGDLPSWWQFASAHEISRAAIEAVGNYRP